MSSPIYTPKNCRPAYQLNWAISIFANDSLPPVDHWRPILEAALEPDRLRILECRLASAAVIEFLVTTQPEAAPSFILQRLKGRLQYLLRNSYPKAFRRNYRLESVGSAKREVIEGYVRRQPARHPMADDRIQKRLESLQFDAPAIDLSAVRHSAHGQFIYNLHVVLEHEHAWSGVEETYLEATRSAVQRFCALRQLLLARVGIVASHLHLAVGCDIEDAPADVATGLLNTLAESHGHKANYRFGFFVGTFGNFDLGALRFARQARLE